MFKMNKTSGNKSVELTDKSKDPRNADDIDSSGDNNILTPLATGNCHSALSAISSHNRNDVSDSKPSNLDSVKKFAARKLKPIAKNRKYSNEETRSHSFQSAIEKRSKAKLYKMGTKEAVNVYMRRLQARIVRKREHIASVTENLEEMITFEREATSNEEYSPVVAQNLYSPLFAYPEHF